MPAGEFGAEDWLDDDGVTGTPLKIAVRLTLDPAAGSLAIDFAGTSPQATGSVNAVRAITLSACFYILRCLVPDDAPATEGILRPLTLQAPEGTLVNALPPAPVAGGNVETSQRIVDVLLRALAKAAPHRIPAASAGTMSNLTIGGVDPRTGEPFTYYETCAGGMGARPGLDGISGVQTHMTNSLNTPLRRSSMPIHCACADMPIAITRAEKGSTTAATAWCARSRCSPPSSSRCLPTADDFALTASKEETKARQVRPGCGSQTPEKKPVCPESAAGIFPSETSFASKRPVAADGVGADRSALAEPRPQFIRVQ